MREQTALRRRSNLSSDLTARAGQREQKVRMRGRALSYSPPEETERVRAVQTPECLLWFMLVSSSLETPDFCTLF
ncbi:unnamed protein product [Pleuronectes platessa]|uniref:Uncharacterized protein n=1 Tax=Pleuronectes platessa TaxID=8262 RepID=A0A9N7YEH6_PLEPL|nr:unnamed protein product [Pleuronectes platessa]